MYRKGVSALIVNNKDEFLIVNLESFEKKYFAIPGGGLDEGETLEQAVYREIQEELGIGKESLEIVGKSSKPLRFKFKEIKLSREGIEYKGSERHFFGFKFTDKNSEIVPQDSEVRTFRWVSFTDLGKYLLFDLQVEETTEQILELFPDLNKQI
jgi:putative (di)nucleoside polyphosphate hydrolase